MNRRAARWLAACVPFGLVMAMLAQALSAAAAGTPGPRVRPAAAPPSPSRLASPAAVLPRGWRSSRDREVTVAADAAGLHVLVADEAAGYAWRTVATLGVPGVDTTEWVGQACVTASGTRAVVVYAPRQITNMGAAQGTAALAAVVDLGSGTVTPVAGGFSIAYFSPGCGTGEQTVLSQGGWGEARPGSLDATRLVLIDARTGKTVYAVTERGQVTSPVPYRGQIAAAYGPGLVTIGAGGRVRTLTRTRGAAFRLAPDSAGGLGYQVMAGGQVQVRRYAAGRDQLVGTAPAGSVDLAQVSGHVWVTGPHASGLGRLPAGWRAANVPVLSQVSTGGTLVVTSVASARPQGRGPQAAPGSPWPVQIGAQVISTGKHVAFTVPTGLPSAGTAPPAAPGGRAGGHRVRQRAAARPGRQAPADPATVTYDPDRTCAVPRNDPSLQAYAPSIKQLNWAVDEAVQGSLTGQRGPDLYGSGLASYTPQGMFPAPGLAGGGSVPAQVLFGVLTQESNLEQASSHVITGQTGNFLPSYNWYGNWEQTPSGPSDLGQVDWANVDCGYGMAQITSGMCMAGNPNCPSVDGPALPADQQKAVAIDYQANIAAGLQVLEQKWNELHDLGITANDGDPQYIENWWFALWDYNTGLQPNAAHGNTSGCSPSPSCTDSGGNWGLGWLNNPANDIYPPDRPGFLDASSRTTPDGGSYSAAWDQAHPQFWSYEEKVIGFAFNAFTTYNYVDAQWEQAYPYGLWRNSPDQVDPALPALTALCTAQNQCDPTTIDPGSNQTQGADPCQQTGALEDHCWWHWSLNWLPTGKSCADVCGVQVLTFDPGDPDPGSDGVPPGYAPDCSTSGTLPSNAVIVDDVTTPAALGCPGKNWSTAGSISWSFGSDNSTGTYPSKIDFHQIGAGFGGHFWVTHAIPSDQSNLFTSGAVTRTVPADPSLQITGTWRPPSSMTGWTRVMVHIPNYGAWTPDADYQVNPGGGGATTYRIVNQAQQANTWVDLGFFDLGAGASVSLSNVSWENSPNGTDAGYDIAWDAAAFIPLGRSPGYGYVAMGDSYSAGEGVAPYAADSDYNYAGMIQTCHRSTQAYPELVRLPGNQTTIAQQAAQPGSATSFTFMACSGQETNAMSWDPGVVDNPKTAWDAAGYTDWGDPQLNSGAPSDPTDPANGVLPTVQSTAGELPQAAQGWLSPQTKLVTITAGGNDARFGDIMTACVETDALTDPSIPGCSASGYHLQRTDLAGNQVTDPQPLVQMEPAVIQNLEPHLEALYRAVAAAAPNATILVIGYPDLFPGGQNATACTVYAGVTLTGPDVRWLNSMGDQMDLQTLYAATAVGADTGRVFYLDPNDVFQDHRICDPVPWINGVVTKESSNSGWSTPGNNSFHPNADGQAALARLVNNFLATGAQQRRRTGLR